MFEKEFFCIVEIFMKTDERASVKLPDLSQSLLELTFNKGI